MLPAERGREPESVASDAAANASEALINSARTARLNPDNLVVISKMLRSLSTRVRQDAELTRERSRQLREKVIVLRQQPTLILDHQTF